MSDLEFKPVNKFFRETSSSIKCKKLQIQTISLYTYTTIHHINHTPLGLLGYCKPNATVHPTEEKAVR